MYHAGADLPCALEYESVGMVRSGQSEQEPFHGEALQQFAERPLLALGPIEEALPDGNGHISRGLQSVASKYGRITRSTRHALA